mgnify:CR=1 FL=1
MAGSIVQSKFNEAAAAATTIATGSFGSNVTANNWLWILVNGDAADTTTITQNSGTATIGSVTQQSSSIGPGPGILEEWTSLTCQITGTGSLDLLCTFGGSRSNRQILAFEITGVNAVDSGGGASQADGGTNPTPSLSITVGSQPAFCLAACVDYQGGTPGVGTGFTNAGTFGATVNFIRAQTKAITSTGATTGDFVNGGLDVNNSAMIVFDEPSTPTISAQPVQQTAASGATATFNTTTTGATSFQWQEQVSGAWTNVSTGTGGTSEDYTTATLSSADNGRQFRLQATNAAGTTDSAEVFLFITGQPITGKGRKGWGSAWWKRSVRKAGPISGLKLAELRKRPSRGPNFDNADFIAAWNDWYFPAAAGSGSHATTGALSAQDATLAGTAAHLTLHATTGALSAQDAAIAGTAQHQHTTDGALSSQDATIAGTAAHATLHTSTGVLDSQAATISGTAAHGHATSGTLAAQDATIAGAADHTVAGASHATSGALAAQDATLAGSAAHLTLHTTSGALTAQASSIAGTAAHQHVATGALAAQDATVDGAAAHLSLHTSTGALAADAATISGAAAHEHTSTGALAAQAATVDGVAVHSAAGTHDATGALAAQDATMSGVAEHIGTGESVLSPKFLGSPNVVIRGVKVEGKAADATPLPAQITNMPDAPPPVALSPSIMDLLGFAPPVTPLPIQAPEIPELKVTVKPRKEPPAPDPAPEAAPLPPPPPPPPVPRAEVDQMQVEAAAREKALSAQIASLEAEAAEVENALVRARARLVKVKQALAQRKQTVAQRKMNRQRAEEITRRLLKDLAEED